MFNLNKGINDVDDFNEYASAILEAFLEPFTESEGLIRPIREDDDYIEGAKFMYTARGGRLAHRMQQRLYAVGHRHFPDEDLQVGTSLLLEP